jgi:hypothetical protein
LHVIGFRVGGRCGGDLENKKRRSLAGAAFCLCGGLDQAPLLPAAIFRDRYALSALRQLDELRAIASGDNPLAGATRKPIQLAPVVK